MLRRFRGRRPSLPTALALLALSIALTGTAFAATGQLVNIVDPGNPAQAAKVDSSGALRTSLNGNRLLAPPTPFAASTSLTANVLTPLTSPTSATLAFTRFEASNLADSVLHAAFQISLYQVAGSANTCNGPVTWLVSYDVSPSDTVVDSLPTALTLKPPAGFTQYCLEALATLSNNPGSYYLPHIAWSGYVVSGTFNGASTTGSRSQTLKEATAKHVG
jgi:hypothetical protein